MIETCVNCGGKMAWGPSMSRHDYEDHGRKRICPRCGSEFDYLKPRTEFSMKSLLK